MEKKITYISAEEEEESAITVPFVRVMTEEDRKLPYRSRRLEPKKALHWGQRKLLLSEIEFLTNFGDMSKTVLYVGAADGQHIIFLAGLFPEHKFILYDPVDFYEGVEDIPMVEIHKELFTLEEHVPIYVDKNVLFISDIRIIPEEYKARQQHETVDEIDTSYDLEENVKRDMDLQMKIHLGIKPIASLLKFRLPYTPGTTEYLKGDVYYQMWSPSTSTECRLVVQGTETVIYDHTDHESRMYRFNRCTRFQLFDLPIEVPGILGSYDLLGELYVLMEYLIKVKKKSFEESPNFLKGMLVALTRFFGKSLEDKYEEAKSRYENRLAKTVKNTTFGRRPPRDSQKKPDRKQRRDKNNTFEDPRENVERKVYNNAHSKPVIIPATGAAATIENRDPQQTLKSMPKPVSTSMPKPAPKKISTGGIKVMGALPKKKPVPAVKRK
jgi:hypothetical protein